MSPREGIRDSSRSGDGVEIWGRNLSERIDDQSDSIEKLRDKIGEMSGKIIRLETKLLFISGIFGFAAGFVPMVINYLLGKKGP